MFKYFLFILFINSCQAKNNFKSTEENLNIKEIADARKKEANTLSNNAININCNETDKTIMSEYIAKQVSFVFDKTCSKTVTKKRKNNSEMNVIFVSDVTGTMKKTLDIFRNNVVHIKEELIKIGYQKVKFSAIPFADEILGIVNFEDNADIFLQKISHSQSDWSTPNGFGGDITEIGLLAIDKSFNLYNLESSDKDFIIFYMSDAPATMVDKGNYDTANLIKNINIILNKKNNRDNLIFIASVPNERSQGFYDSMPIPSEQIKEVFANIKINYKIIDYPLTVETIDKSFIEDIKNRSIIDKVTCTIKHVKFLDNGSNLIEESDLSVDKNFYNFKINTSFKSVKIERECNSQDGNKTEENIVNFVQ